MMSTKIETKIKEAFLQYSDLMQADTVGVKVGRRILLKYPLNNEFFLVDLLFGCLSWFNCCYETRTTCKLQLFQGKTIWNLPLL